MTVLMPNATATIRRRIEGPLNAHGERTRSGLSPRVSALLPALIEQRADGGWTASIDPSLWPVRKNDVIDDSIGRTYVVMTSDLLSNVFEPIVDYILCEVRNVTDEGTEPIDPWFVARDQSAPSPYEGGRAMTGHGPPPEDLADVVMGDKYLDLDSGLMYEWRGEGEGRLISGHGAPPADLDPAPFDQYLDLDTGVIYEHREAS